MARIARTLVYACLTACTRKARQTLTLKDKRVSGLRTQTIVETRVDQTWINNRLTVDTLVARWTVACVSVGRTDASTTVRARYTLTHIYLILAAIVSETNRTIATECAGPRVDACSSVSACGYLTAVDRDRAVVTCVRARAYTVICAVRAYTCATV